MTISRTAQITSLFLALAFILTACLEDAGLESIPQTTPNNAWTEGMTGPALDGTVRVSGRLALARSADQPLRDAFICVDDREDIACSTTDDQGIFTLNALPQEQDLVFTIDSDNDDLFPTLVMYRTTDQNEAFQTTPLPRFFTRDFELRFTEDTNSARGHIVIKAIHAREVGADAVTGFTATLELNAFEGQLYASDFTNANNVRLEANDTTSQSAFFNVIPGTFDVTINHPTLTCTPWQGLTSDSDNAVRLQVQADHVTHVTVVCQ